MKIKKGKWVLPLLSFVVAQPQGRMLEDRGARAGYPHGRDSLALGHDSELKSSTFRPLSVCLSLSFSLLKNRRYFDLYHFARCPADGQNFAFSILAYWPLLVPN